MNTCNGNLSTTCESSHQTLNHENIIPLEKIPAEILMNKINCAVYVNCSQQNGTQFGFIPLTHLKVYTGEHISNNAVHDIVDLHTTVKASSLPNFMACRIRLQSQLNISNWKKYLVNYWDQQLVDLKCLWVSFRFQPFSSFAGHRNQPCFSYCLFTTY